MLADLCWANRDRGVAEGGALPTPRRPKVVLIERAPARAHQRSVHALSPAR